MRSLYSDYEQLFTNFKPNPIIKEHHKTSTSLSDPGIFALDSQEDSNIKKVEDTKLEYYFCTVDKM